MKAKDIGAGGSKSWQQRLWRRERLHALGLTIVDEYDKYLETPHWKAFQKEAFAQQRERLGHNRCEHCSPGAPQSLYTFTTSHMNG